MIVAALGVTLLFLSGYRMLIGSLPYTRGRLVLEGLGAEAEVFRDGYGVPYVFAGSDRDLFFLQGFVTAQDRLWQMDLLRRTAAGRLSEWFGSGALATDSLMRALGLRASAEAGLERLAASRREALDSYSRGVNACISLFGKNLPVEYRLMKTGIEPWTPGDCIAVHALTLLEAAPGWRTAPVAVALLAADRGNSGPAAEEKRVLARLRRIQDEGFLPVPSRGLAFAVSGAKMESESALLAHAPAGPFRIPCARYQVQMRSREFGMSGLSVPGVPGLCSGHNDGLAWAGLASEQSGPSWKTAEIRADGKAIRIRTGGAWENAEARAETLGVRNAAPVIARFLRARSGFVLERAEGPAPGTEGPALGPGAAAPGGRGRAVVLAWRGFEAADGLGCLLELNRSTNVARALEILKSAGAGETEWILADTSGRVASAERRAASWVLTETEKGIVCLGAGSAGGRRLRALLAGADTLTADAARGVLTDAVSPAALALRDRVLGRLAAGGPADTVRALLSGWDGAMKPGSAAAALIETLAEKLTSNAFAASLGDTLYGHYLRQPGLGLPRLVEAVDAWTVDPERKDRTDAWIGRSAAEAVASMKTACGDDPGSWTWAEIHSLAFRHPLGGRPLFNDLFDAGPFPAGFSPYTVEAWNHEMRFPFLVHSGPLARLIVDFASFDNSLSILSTGQSGQPMDEHYRDQIRLFLDHCYRPDPWSEDRIRRSGWSLLEIKPPTRQ